MLVRLVKHATLCFPTGAALLLMAFMTPEASAQRYISGPCCNQPAPCQTPAAQPAQQPAPVGQPPAPVGQQPAPEAQAPSFTPEQSAATGGSEFAAFTPQVIGDGGSSSQATSAYATARLNAAKISENQSPRPTDRIYLGYNYFSNVSQQGFSTTRSFVGFEKTFADGNASFGIAIPYFSAVDGAGITGLGDANLVMKYALINDRTTGNVFTAGLVLTLPTGAGVPVTPPAGVATTSNINDVIIQPWLGYIYNIDDFYVQGFSSVLVPTDSRDVTLLANDISFGYWAYRSNQDKFLTGVIPTIEGHLNDPLNHRNSVFGVAGGMVDSFVTTLGTHLVFNQRSLLTLGYAVPLTSPRPFDAEFIAQFNYKF